MAACLLSCHVPGNGWEMICYYKILGISIRASQDEIKKAFRMLAFRFHPDMNPADPDAARRFREVLKAYETLVDPRLRGKYDSLRGYSGAKRKRGGVPGPERDNGNASVNDVLHEFFGIQYSAAKERRGSDLRFDLQLPRVVISEGAFEEIRYARWVFCGKCVGNGKKRPLNSCESCQGRGEVEEWCTVKVWVPPGSEEGTRVKIPGGGDRLSPAGTAGDLYVLLHIV